MHVYEPFAKARHEELLRAAAHHRLAARPRRARATVAAPADPATARAAAGLAETPRGPRPDTATAPQDAMPKITFSPPGQPADSPRLVPQTTPGGVVREAAKWAAGTIAPAENRPAPGGHQACSPAERGHDREETTMRPAFLYYLVQTWAADPYRQARRQAPARAASRARHTPRRGHRARRLPAVVARRMLTVLGGGGP